MALFIALIGRKNWPSDTFLWAEPEYSRKYTFVYLLIDFRISLTTFAVKLDEKHFNPRLPESWGRCLIISDGKCMSSFKTLFCNYSRFEEDNEDRFLLSEISISILFFIWDFYCKKIIFQEALNNKRKIKISPKKIKVLARIYTITGGKCYY